MSNKYLGGLKCCLLSVALFIGLSASETFAVELNPNSELTLSYFTDTQTSGDDSSSDDSSSDDSSSDDSSSDDSSSDENSSDENSSDENSSDAVCPADSYPVYSSGDEDSSSSDNDSKSEDDDSKSGDDDSKSEDDDSNSGDDDDGSSRSFECVACTEVSAVFSFNSRNVIITGQSIKQVTLVLADSSELDFDISDSIQNNDNIKLPNNDENTSQSIVSIRVTTKCNTSQTIDGPALGNPNYDG